MPIEVREPTDEERVALETCPIWEKEPSTFPWQYDQKETCLILAGRVTVEGGGQTVELTPGDLAIFPQGLECTWTVHEPVRKYYRFG